MASETCVSGRVPCSMGTIIGEVKEDRMSCSRISWTRQAVDALVRLVKAVPILWNSKHGDYQKKVLKRNFYVEVAIELQLLFPHMKGITADSVMQKFGSLKSCFRREEVKFKAMRDGLGVTLPPKWGLYKSLSFLSEPDPIDVSSSNLEVSRELRTLDDISSSSELRGVQGAEVQSGQPVHLIVPPQSVLPGSNLTGTSETSHTETPGQSHVTAPLSRVETPGQSHVTTPPSHTETPGQSHVRTPPSHTETPGQSHVTTPPSHTETPGQSHVTTPPSRTKTPGQSLVTTPPSQAESHELEEVGLEDHAIQIKTETDVEVEETVLVKEFYEETEEITNHFSDHADQSSTTTPSTSSPASSPSPSSTLPPNPSSTLPPIPSSTLPPIPSSNLPPSPSPSLPQTLSPALPPSPPSPLPQEPANTLSRRGATIDSGNVSSKYPSGEPGRTQARKRKRPSNQHEDSPVGEALGYKRASSTTKKMSVSEAAASILGSLLDKFPLNRQIELLNTMTTMLIKEMPAEKYQNSS